MKISHRLNLAMFAGSLAGIAAAIWIAITAISSADQTQVAVERAFESTRYAVESRNLMTAANDNITNVLRMDNVERLPDYESEHIRISDVLAYVAGEIEANAGSDELQAAVLALRQEVDHWKADADVLVGIVPSTEVPTVEVMDRHNAALDRLMADVTRQTNLDATLATTRIKEQLLNSVTKKLPPIWCALM